MEQLLKPGGKLIVDEKNYSTIIEKIRYPTEGLNICHGVSFAARARDVYVNVGMVITQYWSKANKAAYSVHYPFKEGELKKLLQFVFPNTEIRSYGDYKKQFDLKETYMITHVVRR